MSNKRKHKNKKTNKKFNFSDTGIQRIDSVGRQLEEIKDMCKIAREKGALTWHGLRHTYAQHYYTKMREKGFSDQASRYKLTEVLGHGRIEITYVYVPKGFIRKKGVVK